MNPYVDNPPDHLLPFGILIKAIPGDRKGLITELTLELNRAELMERRRERIESLSRLATLYALESVGKLKNLIKRELKREIESDKEYVFVAKAYLRQSCGIS